MVIIIVICMNIVFVVSAFYDNHFLYIKEIMAITFFFFKGGGGGEGG